MGVIQDAQNVQVPEMRILQDEHSREGTGTTDHVTPGHVMALADKIVVCHAGEQHPSQTARLGAFGHEVGV